MAAYTTNYNELDVNGNTIYYYVGGYTGNYYAYVTYATSSYNSYSGNVVIPQTVTTNDKTYTVKYIDEAAFKNSTGLTSVTLPSSIIQISKNAFEGCSGLTTINLGETSVTSIGNYVFKGCTSLESITIPATATSLGTNVFEGCTNLASITIPSSVTSIGSNTFDGCTRLTTVTINSNLTSIPANLFKGCTSLSSVTIPSTVTTINGSAFYNCSSLTSINIPSGVTSIGYQAFYGCTSLANVSYNATSCGDFSSAVFSASTADLFTVTIGDNVTRLPNNVFNGLTHLTSITIPSSVVSIGNFAFYNCTGLTSINMSSSVESIGNSAFYCCSGLTSIALPSTLSSIGSNAFQYCSGLTEITIPSSVTTMGTSAFNNCSGLTEITYNAIELSDFTSSNYPFRGCSYNNITLNIGFGVTKIPSYVFCGTKLTGSIIIPGSVTSIGTKAFANNAGNYTNLTTVYMLGTTVPELADASVFQTGYSSYCSVKVFYSEDHSILTDYQEAENWSSFSSNISETNNFTVTNMDLTGIAAPVTIPSGNTLTVTGTATNPTAANLTIEDGGRLVFYNPGVQATVKKEIEGVGNENWNAPSGADGWYFIASPVNGADFPTGTNNNQDIYQLDWANSQWLNLQNDAHISLLDAGFQRGTGYLYASKEDKTLSVTGEIQPLSNNNDATVTLAVAGWNLIGNPLTCKVTVSTAFTELTDDGSAPLNQVEGTAINPFQGIAVYGNAGTTVTFTKAASQNAVPSNNALQMTLSQTIATRGSVSSEVVDNAIVKFNGNSSMPKFSMLEGKAKLYIPQDKKEYAIVSTKAQGEMPVNFETTENGTYTITVNPEGIEMAYLHLIDNLTGADIDLMTTPSYTFNATVNDYASRFRLMFSANNIEETIDEEQPFAFISNGQLIVSNEGEATLQVIDVTGRVISSEAISGSCSKAVNAATGVYVLKLVSEDHVRTQKIVFK